MMMRNILAASMVAISLTACGASAKMAMQMDQLNQQKLAAHKMTVAEVTSSVKDVPAQFLSNVKGYLESSLIKRGLLAVKETNHANKIEVNITYYRMRSEFSRLMFGALAGKDGIDAKVIVTDANGNKIATLDASSYNMLAGGDDSDAISRMFAEDIVKTLEKNIASAKKPETMASH